MNFKLLNNQNGSMLITVIAVTGIFLAITLGQVGLVTLRYKLNVRKVAKAQALHVAEAGVNYYRWVLYHDHQEYNDHAECLPGSECGPFEYSYTDDSGEISGHYQLFITPPPANGSTIVKVRSVGWITDYPAIKRSIEVRCGIPSWSSYSTLADDYMRFGEGTEVWGQIHSNKGIRFDGIAHNIITSSVATTTDPEDGSTQFGVYNVIPSPEDPTPDANVPAQNVPYKPNIFMAGRSFPVNAVSFSVLTNYIDEIQGLATSSGILFDPAPSATADPDSVEYFRGCGQSGSFCDAGFHITLLTSDQFTIRGVTSVSSNCGTSSNSIGTEDSNIMTYDIPENGIIFVKKKIWVDGNINNSRVSIYAFEKPYESGVADININNDIEYTNYDGTDAIGLIAQHDINIGLNSEGSMSGSADEQELRIDAGLIAKNGRIGRFYYSSSCTNYERNIITIYGSMATKVRYGFAYICGSDEHWCSGYHTRNLRYDNNLTFAPPPHFPTTGEYTFISWKEN